MFNLAWTAPEYSMLPCTSNTGKFDRDRWSCSMSSSTCQRSCNVQAGCASEMTYIVSGGALNSTHSPCSSWWSWSTDAWTAGHLSTSPFTASHCPARAISVPLSKIYCTYHVTDWTRMAAPGPLPLLGRPPGTFFQTLSATQTTSKILSGAC